MTLTSPVSGSHPTRRRRITARAGGWVTAIVLAFAPLTTGAAAAVPPAGSSGHAALPGDPAGSVGVTIAPSDSGLIQADQPLTVTVSVTNTTPSTVLPADVRLAVGPNPLATRTALTDWLADADADDTDSDDDVLEEIGTTLVDAVAPLGTQTTVITVDAVTTGLATRSPGVYPLRAVYEMAAGPLAVASVVVVPPPAAAAAASIGVVVPIVAGPLDTGLLTATQLTELTGPLGSLTAQLDAVAGTPAILAVDPAIPAAIRVLGSSAPDDARMWLDRLLTLPNSRFALQFGDADLATQIRAGVNPLLTPATLQPYLRAQNFPAQTEAGAPEQAPTPETSPPPVDDGPAFPTLAELTDIGQGETSATVLWPATGSAGGDVVAALAAMDPASLTLISSATTSASSGARATAGDADLLVYDSDVSSSLTAVAATEDGITRAAALAETSAYAALAMQEVGDGSLLVVVDRGALRSRLALRTAITAASTLPGYAPVDLGTLAAASPDTVEVGSADSGGDRADTVSRLLADESALTDFASVLADPTVLTAPERTSLLQLIGNAWRDLPDSWTTAVTEHRVQTHETLDAVGISPPSDINLLGSTAPLGFAVRNDLPWPVSLVLTAYPSEPVLIMQSTTPVEAGAKQNTRVDVPVEARVGNGSTSIDLQLRSLTGVPIGESRSVAVTVRAEWESVWIAVLAAGVSILFVGGVMRTVLRVRRRSRRGVDARTTETTDAANTDSDDVSGTGTANATIPQRIDSADSTKDEASE